MSDSDYYVVRGDVLPEVFLKVMAVKRLIGTGAAGSVNEAVRTVGLSRSAYYKYRDAIRPYLDLTKQHMVTLALVVEHVPGLLAMLIRCLTEAGCNVLTINQNMPINGLADLSISLDIGELKGSVDDLMLAVDHVHGVRFHQVLTRAY